MQSFAEYLIERKNTEKAGGASDEGSFAHLAQWASDNLLYKGKDITLDVLIGALKRAQRSGTHPLSFENAPEDIFAGKIKATNPKSKEYQEQLESYEKQLEVAAHSLMAVVEHPDFKNFLKHGYKVIWLGKHYGQVSELWNNDGIFGGSSATSKTDIAFISADGDEIYTFSLKQKAGALIFSGASRESAATLRVAINRTIDDLYGGDEKMRAEYMAKVDKIKKSVEDVKNLSTTKKILDEITETLGEPFLINFYREALTAENKFKDARSRVTHVLGLSMDDPKFETTAEHMSVFYNPDKDGYVFRLGRRGGYYGIGPRIYATLPKHEGDIMGALRLAVIDVNKQKKQWIATQRENIDNNDFEAFKEEFDYPIEDEAAMRYWKKISLDHEQAKQEGKVKKLQKSPKQTFPRMTMFHDVGKNTQKKSTPKQTHKPSDKPRPTADFAGGGFDQEWAGPNDFSTRAVSTKRAKPGAAKPNGKSKGKTVSKPMANRKSIAKPTVSPHLAKPGLLNRIRGAFAGPQKDKRKIDWQNIETDFKTGRDRVEDIGTRYKVDPSTIYKAARLKKWARSKHMETI